MEFSNSAQSLTYERVRDYLTTGSHRSSVRMDEQRPYFDFLYQQNTLIEVYVLPWDNHPYSDVELAIVRASSCIAIGCGPELELLRFLLAENRKMRFGSFQLDETGVVYFANRILGGKHMDLRELEVCLLAVGAISTRYSDIIAQRFGGQRALATVLKKS